MVSGVKSIYVYGIEQLLNCLEVAASMTPSEAHECYMAGERGLTIPTVTEKGRPRNIARLKWRTLE